MTEAEKAAAIQRSAAILREQIIGRLDAIVAGRADLAILRDVAADPDSELDMAFAAPLVAREAVRRGGAA